MLFFLSFPPLFYSPDFFLLFPSFLFPIVFVFVIFFLALKFLSCFTSLPMGNPCCPGHIDEEGSRNHCCDVSVLRSADGWTNHRLLHGQLKIKVSMRRG